MKDILRRQRLTRFVFPPRASSSQKQLNAFGPLQFWTKFFAVAWRGIGMQRHHQAPEGADGAAAKKQLLLKLLQSLPMPLIPSRLPLTDCWSRATLPNTDV